MLLSDPEVKWITRHEAGHALAGWICGEKIRLVTTVGPKIKMDYSDEKTPFYCSFDYGERVATDAGIQAHAAHGLMPLVIEEHEESEITSWHDSQIITDRLGHSCAKDREVVNFCHDNYDDPDLPKKFYEKYKHHAEEIYSDPRAAKCLDALSGKLKAEGSVGGQETARLFEKTWGSLPEKALPFKDHWPSLKLPREKLSFEISLMDASIYLDRAIESVRDAVCDTAEEENVQEDLLKDLLIVKFKWGT
jgi:hypothetical protein